MIIDPLEPLGYEDLEDVEFDALAGFFGDLGAAVESGQLDPSEAVDILRDTYPYE